MMSGFTQYLQENLHEHIWFRLYIIKTRAAVGLCFIKRTIHYTFMRIEHTSIYAPYLEIWLLLYLNFK